MKAHCRKGSLHRRVTRVDRTTVYNLEQDGIQECVTYDEKEEKLPSSNHKVTETKCRRRPKWELREAKGGDFSWELERARECEL